MDRKWSWIAPVVVGAIWLTGFYFEMGGLAGLTGRPAMSLIALAAVAAIVGFQLWRHAKTPRRPKPNGLDMEARPRPRFAAFVADTSDLPYRLRVKGFDLGIALAGYGFFLISAVSIFAIMLNGRRANATVTLVELATLIVAGLCAYRLWLLRSPWLILYPDRLDKRELTGWRSISRSDVEGVRSAGSDRRGPFFEVVSSLPDARGIRLRQALRTSDPVVGRWFEGVRDLTAEALAADRSAILSDPRYGATEAARTRRLQIARGVATAFNAVGVAVAAWVYFNPQPYLTVFIVALAAPLLGGLLVAASDELILWLGPGKSRPMILLGAIAPIGAMTFHATFFMHLVDPAPLLWVAVAAAVLAAGVAITRVKSAVKWSLAAGAAFAAAVCSFGLIAFLDVALDHSTSKVFAATVMGKRINRGRSTTYDLDVGPWDGRKSGEIPVPESFFKTQAIGSVVCLIRRDGALRLAWFDIQACPTGSASAPPELPDTAAGALDVGNARLDQGRFDEAIDDFTRSLKLNPKNAFALADRGVAHAWKGEQAAAKADLDAAAAVDPNNFVMLHGRALLAMQTQAFNDAIAALSAALKAQPHDAFALNLRAQAYRGIGDYDSALVDANAVIGLNPGWLPPHLLRAALLRSEHQDELAAKEAHAIVVGFPGNDRALAAAASLYAALGLQADAMRTADQAIAVHPSPLTYLYRSQLRPKTDMVDRRADIDHALQLEPRSPPALAAKAKLQEDTGDLDGAIATWSTAADISPHSPTILMSRAIGYARSGRAKLADDDFAAARAMATTPNALNALCWGKATAGVKLDSALDDCDAGLVMAPNSPDLIDSRAFVLLRMGRFQEASAAYDRALALSPVLASSLYGRAVAEARMGEDALSDRDIDAALKSNPDVKTEFDSYGVTIAPHGGA